MKSTAIATEVDLVELRDTLRAAGASDFRVREIVEGVLRWRFRDAQTAKRLGRIQRGWWLDDQRALAMNRPSSWLPDDPDMLIEMVDKLRDEINGPDPTQVDVVNARYSFMPENLRMKFAQLERDAGRSWVPTGDPEADAKTEAEMAKNLQQTRTEREKLLASLTPDQRREYDMRYGLLGSRLASDLRSVPGVTEEEFRKLYAVSEQSRGPATGSGGFVLSSTAGGGGAMVIMAPAASANGGAASVQARVQADQQVVEQVVATFGYDRALNYLWANTQEYRALAALPPEANLPSNTAAQFAQLAAETGAQALALQNDSTMNLEQRRAALLALQQSARTQVDALVPGPAQQKLPASALAWLNQMSDGRFKVLNPGVAGSGSGSYSMALTAGSAPPLPFVPPPKRPPGL